MTTEETKMVAFPDPLLFLPTRFATRTLPYEGNAATLLCPHREQPAAVGGDDCVRCSNCILQHVKSCNISTLLYNREKRKKKGKSSEEAREKYYSGLLHKAQPISPVLSDTESPFRDQELLHSHPLIDELSPFFWSPPHDQKTGFVLI